MPERIQLHRTRGWRKPEGAIVVARPSRWGNPFTVAEHGSRAAAVEAYRRHLDADPALRQAAREQLAGHALACWCPGDGPCHADILLDIANAPCRPTHPAAQRTMTTNEP